MQVQLNEEQTNSLKQYIYQITQEGIEEARRNAGMDKVFLKQKYMAEWLGVSVNTLKKMEANNLPSIMIDGIKFYSKDEVSKWILKHQK